jgi:2-dehydro-3-deoxygalactonokinase
MVTILSSHTKFVPIDQDKRICGSVTTISGQLYEAILKETFVGKSVRAEDDFDDSDYFDPQIVDYAFEEIERGGLIRSLMYIRFLDVLVHARWYERKLFAEALLAAEDMRSIPQVQELTGISPANTILVGHQRRCRIYEHLLRSKVNGQIQVRMITEEADIDHLSIRGVIRLAKMRGIL